MPQTERGNEEKERFYCRDNDVLLGRGKATHIHTGNVRFRELVSERALAYRENTETAFRRTVALDIIGIVHANNGRFIKRDEAKNDQGTTDALWEIVSDDVAFTKVKQALRDSAAAMCPPVKTSKVQPPSPSAVPSAGVASQRNGTDLFAQFPAPMQWLNPVMASNANMFGQLQTVALPPQHAAGANTYTLLQLHQQCLQAHRLQQILAAEERERQTISAATMLLMAANTNQLQNAQPPPFTTPATGNNHMLQQARDQLLLLSQLGLVARQGQSLQVALESGRFAPCAESSAVAVDNGRKEGDESPRGAKRQKR